jgi:uncharacterized protein (TIGR02217 family)
MPANFRDALFPTNISRGSTSSIKWRTRTATSDSGQETRIKSWSTPLREYSFNADFWDEARLQDLINFYVAVAQGDAFSFRFRDWADYYAGYVMTPGVGVSVDLGALQTIGTGNGATVAFQLVKTYTRSGFTYTRTITKPVGGTVKVYVAGVEQLTGWSVNLTTGVVTFSVAPASGTIAAAFHFDTPARFDGDVVGFNLEALRVGRISAKIVEVRE